MQPYTVTCGGSVWSGHTPEEDEDDVGPWDWQRSARQWSDQEIARLIHTPGWISPTQARLIVAAGRELGRRMQEDWDAARTYAGPV